MRIYFVLILLILITGCASKSVRIINQASYDINREDLAVIGTAFIYEEHGTEEENEHWEGVLFGGMHKSYLKGDDYRRVEVYYGGRTGDILSFVYQATIGNSSSPSIRRTFEHDLRRGSIVTIEEYELQVLSANNNSMRYKVTQKR
jgi:hypothetical protein